MPADDTRRAAVAEILAGRIHPKRNLIPIGDLDYFLNLFDIGRGHGGGRHGFLVGSIERRYAVAVTNELLVTRIDVLTADGLPEFREQVSKIGLR